MAKFHQSKTTSNHSTGFGGQDRSSGSDKEWARIAENIGKTTSDIKGTKDTTRMQQAIWNKAGDNK